MIDILWFIAGLAAGYAAGLNEGRKRGPMTPQEKMEHDMLNKISVIIFGLLCISLLVIIVFLKNWLVFSWLVALALLALLAGFVYVKFFMKKLAPTKKKKK